MRLLLKKNGYEDKQMKLEEAAVKYMKKSYKILDNPSMSNDEKIGRLSEKCQMYHEAVPIEEFLIENDK